MRRPRFIALLLLTGCDPIITSIGSWNPDLTTEQYIEAESGELSQGFTIGDDSSASGGRFILPPAGVTSDEQPGQALARYAFRIASSGTYTIWGRIKSPGALNNRFWFQVDGSSFRKWRISTGEIWYWDDFHNDADYGAPVTFALSEGTHELVIANCVDGVELDRLYITSQGDTPPGNDTPCNPPHSIQVNGQCVPSCGSFQNTTCGTLACEGLENLPAYDCDVCCKLP